MLYIRAESLETIGNVRAALQSAIKLEFSTIPAYLTALYTIKPGTNPEVAAILRHVVGQEMLHMCLACNILNAVGGWPALADPSSLPAFPGPLPMGIGCEPGKPFIVPLKKLSLDLVQDVFMAIEEPERPLEFPVKAAVAGEMVQYHTIGEFYRDLAKVIDSLGPPIFTGDPARQVTGWFGKAELFPIQTVAAASRAIKVIVSQGEGTTWTPLDEEGALAHYYLFAQIRHGKLLVKDESTKAGFSYSGAPIAFDPAGVWPMLDNPPDVSLPPGSTVSGLADDFDLVYSHLINALQATVDGHPEHLAASVGLMYSLRLAAQALIAAAVPGTDGNAGPRFRFMATA